MKRFLSILMLGLFLLNTVGFYGFYAGLQAVKQNSFNEKLDIDSYAESESFTFKIPLSVPYQTGNDEYKRVKGQFEKDGEIFQLVKQKLSRDTLYIVCVKDNESKKISLALTDYVKTFTDHQSNSKQSNSKKVFSPIKEYTIAITEIKATANGWHMLIEFKQYEFELPALLENDIIYPPRIIFAS